jgi:hypothetical protein
VKKPETGESKLLTPLGSKLIILIILIVLTPFYIRSKNALKKAGNGESSVIFIAIFIGPLLGGIGIYAFLYFAQVITFYLSAK